MTSHASPGRDSGPFISGASELEVRQAFSAGRAAFRAWSRTPVKDRVRLIGRLRRLIADGLDGIVASISSATGKPPAEALMSDILPVLELLKYYQTHAESILADRRVKTPLTFHRSYSYVTCEPLGIVVVIAPWNYPFQLALAPVASAVIAGNSVILKPSELTGPVGELIADLFLRAGFPAHTVQVVCGNGTTAARLIDGAPDMIFFTGSADTGRKVMTKAAENLIPLVLELGGKDPMIVFGDADLDRAARAAVYGACANSGQACVSVERLYVQDRIYDTFVSMIADRVRSVTTGTGAEADMGPLALPRQMDIIDEQVRDARSKGAWLITPYAPDDRLLPPLILTDVDHSMLVMNEETFGPVLPIMPFATEEQALRLANDSHYGLNASVWTRDLKKGRRVAKRIRAGNCAVNDVLKNIGNPNLPFGGIKRSGFGKYHGPDGLYAFSNRKSVMVYAGSSRQEINWFPYSGELYGRLSAFLRMLHGSMGIPEKIRTFAGTVTFFRKHL